MANEAIMKFAASASTVISKAGVIADEANTVTADATELDNSADLYPVAVATLDCQDAFAAAPGAGAAVHLYMIRNETDGANDDVPSITSSTDILNAEYVGSFPVDVSDVAHRKTMMISLMGVTKAYFYIKNDTGQQMSYSSNAITVKITPMTLIPG